MTIDDPMGDEVHGGAVPDPPAPDEGAVDRLRDAPVGTNDPNIVGDVGPTDVPPGEDPPDLVGQVAADEPGAQSDPDRIPGADAFGQAVD